jgi:hypothetical protein
MNPEFEADGSGSIDHLRGLPRFVAVASVWVPKCGCRGSTLSTVSAFGYNPPDEPSYAGAGDRFGRDSVVNRKSPGTFPEKWRTLIYLKENLVNVADVPNSNYKLTVVLGDVSVKKLRFVITDLL